MLRLCTKVTTSPSTWRRRSSATSATAATSRPRAANRVTISSLAELLAEQHTGEHLGHRATGAGPARAPAPAGSTAAPEYQAVLRGPMWSTSMPSSTCSRLAGVMRCTNTAPGIVAAEALGVGAVHHREAQRLVEPALGVEHELGVDREPGREREAVAPR